MYYKSPKMGMGKSYSKYEYYKPGPSHSGANVFEKMSYKSAMSMSYKGKGSYVYPYMSKGGYTSSKGKGGGYTSTKGKGGYSSSKGKGGYTSGKGKGGSIRMMSVKGKGKGKGKGGAIYGKFSMGLFFSGTRNSISLFSAFCSFPISNPISYGCTNRRNYISYFSIDYYAVANCPDTRTRDIPTCDIRAHSVPYRDICPVRRTLRTQRRRSVWHYRGDS